MLRRVEEQLEALKALRAQGATGDAETALRKALRDRVNVVVAKAATVGAELELTGLLPDLCAAFERLLNKGEEADRQCWAKSALARALASLGWAESRLFLAGARHVQLEAVWGGKEDTAATLRGMCTLALVQTTDLPRSDILRQLVRALGDAQRNVRLNAVRALEQMGGDEAALVLQLKAQCGDLHLDVVGQVFDSFLQVAGEAGVMLVAEYLADGREGVAEEAALSLGASHLPGAAGLLIAAWEETKEADVQIAVLRGLGTSRQEAAVEFLLSLVAGGRQRVALMAIDALGIQQGREKLSDRVAEAVSKRGEEEIRERFRKVFPAVTNGS